MQRSQPRAAIFPRATSGCTSVWARPRPQTIEIRWPSGIRQVLKDVHAGQILQVDEPVEK